MTKEKLHITFEKLEELQSTSQFVEAKSIALELLEKVILLDDNESLAKVYKTLGKVNSKLSDYTSGFEFLEKAQQIFSQLENKNDLSDVYNTMGTVYNIISEYSKSLEYYEKALLINQGIDNREGEAANLGNIGMVYKNLYDYPNALLFYEKALKIFKETGRNVDIAISLGNIGNVFSMLSDKNKALEYYLESLKINEDIKYKQGIAISYGNVGKIFLHNSDYQKALEYIGKSLIINEELGIKNSIAINLTNIGIVYIHLSDYKNAVEFFPKALNIFEEIGNKYGIANCLLHLGNIYSTKESELFIPEKAEEYLLIALQRAEEIKAKEIIKTIFDQLHTLRINQGNLEQALEFYKKSVEIEKEIQSEDAKKKALLFDQRRKIEEDEKARQLKLARFQEQEKILHNILPVNIADRILNQESFIADHFHSVSVLFMDLVGFTALSSIAPPKQLVFLLDNIFSKADEIVESFGLEKIKTIGDGYLAVANVTTPLEEHQKATALAAMKLIETMRDLTVKIPSELGETDWINNVNNFEIRIGIHTGEVVAGIIGKNKYTYDLWGDAVNVASRMESYSEAGRIHVSEEFAKSIENNPEFSLTPRGEITVKGKGTMNTFWLEKGI